MKTKKQLKNHLKALEKLGQAIDHLNMACAFEWVSELENIYDALNGIYCIEIEKQNERSEK